MIRVFVVDDSPFVRKALTKVLQSEPEIRLVGTAASGVEALERIPKMEPDVVTLDVAMQGMDGLKVLRSLLAWRPSLRVIMISAHTHQGAEATLDALAMGAVDFIDKAELDLLDLDAVRRQLRERVLALRPTVENGVPHAAPVVHAAAGEPVLDAARYDVCVIGASTGGPAAVQSVLERLSPVFPIPIVIVQHMPPGFTRPFAERLNRVCRIEVGEAGEGERLRPGRAVIAPAGYHLRLSRSLVTMLGGEVSSSRHVPSVDVLMKSANQARPGRVLGVLLTGMGYDGAEGLSLIQASGGTTIAESAETCAVFGMPRAALERGAVDYLLPLPEIATALAALGAVRPRPADSRTSTP
jgi:two-component system chemotaxis response regulator CheB